MENKEKLTISYPMRIAVSTFEGLQAIARKRVWRMSDTIRQALARGLKSLEKEGKQ